MLFIIGFLLVGFLVMTYHGRNSSAVAVVQQAPQAPPVLINVERGGDDRYTRAPEPLRWYGNNRNDSYQSHGFITTEDGQKLPLYGRRTLSKSDRYNYYTRTDTYNPIPIPITYKKKDCQDSIGCDELMNNEVVNVEDGKGGKVTMYGYNENIYNPFSV